MLISEFFYSSCLPHSSRKKKSSEEFVHASSFISSSLQTCPCHTLLLINDDLPDVHPEDNSVEGDTQLTPCRESSTRFYLTVCYWGRTHLGTGMNVEAMFAPVYPEDWVG